VFRETQSRRGDRSCFGRRGAEQEICGRRSASNCRRMGNVEVCPVLFDLANDLEDGRDPLFQACLDINRRHAPGTSCGCARDLLSNSADGVTKAIGRVAEIRINIFPVATHFCLWRFDFVVSSEHVATALAPFLTTHFSSATARVAPVLSETSWKTARLSQLSHAHQIKTAMVAARRDHGEKRPV